MLKMFEKGWGFKMYNDKHGSWVTYWSLRRRGLLGSGETVSRAGNLVAVDRLTDKGREALAEIRKKDASISNG
jgi:DNA-binding PadR family transcriptional regulator